MTTTMRRLFRARRSTDHPNAVQWMVCPKCRQTISAERYELHMLLCKYLP